jgi:hypothetical protein
MKLAMISCPTTCFSLTSTSTYTGFDIVGYLGFDTPIFVLNESPWLFKQVRSNPIALRCVVVLCELGIVAVHRDDILYLLNT